MKLYEVTLSGLGAKRFFVLADNADTAYEKVKKFCDKEEWGFTADRNLEKVEIVADEDKYNDYNRFLFV